MGALKGGSFLFGTLPQLRFSNVCMIDFLQVNDTYEEVFIDDSKSNVAPRPKPTPRLVNQASVKSEKGFLYLLIAPLALVKLLIVLMSVSQTAELQ